MRHLDATKRGKKVRKLRPPLRANSPGTIEIRNSKANVVQEEKYAKHVQRAWGK